jgi:hypothetical protein
MGDRVNEARRSVVIDLLVERLHDTAAVRDVFAEHLIFSSDKFRKPGLDIPQLEASFGVGEPNCDLDIIAYFVRQVVGCSTVGS